MVHKKCVQCGVGYEVKPARADTSKFCSKSCQTMSSSIEKVCECCGNRFRVPLRRNESVRFCSLTCKTAGRQKLVECEVCKSTFSTEAHKERKYCSRACFHAGAKGSTYAPRPDSERHFRECKVCGKSFRITVTRKESAKYCSRECQFKCQDFLLKASSSKTGANNVRWSGGLYKTGQGYIRHKVKHLGSEKYSMNHRQVMLAWILEVDPSHSFIVTIDDEPRLSPSIEVHHIDRIRSNNQRSNLLAVTKAAHAQIHHKNRKPDPWECWPSNPSNW